MSVRTLRLTAALLALLSTAGCEYMAVRTAPSKQAAASRSDFARQADTVFWRTFHAGQYEKIPSALDVLTAAYLQTPTDPVTAAHVGWLHMWRLAESSRLDPVPASITDESVLARKYFEEAVRLDPSDARYLGFLASAMLAEGSIHRDEKLTRQGYFKLKDAIKAWPEFNHFTAGYVMSNQASDSPRFRQALEWEWNDLDDCTGERVDRENPDFARYMSQATTQGRKRVCWNSWIAPHNFEGFFLNMGDMLVKSGDVPTALKIYANARLSPDFGNWPFREVLEARIRNAPRNVQLFNVSRRGGDGTRSRIMVSSELSCMACHQQ
jgi:hypothetical protein